MLLIHATGALRIVTVVNNRDRLEVRHPLRFSDQNSFEKIVTLCHMKVLLALASAEVFDSRAFRLVNLFEKLSRFGVLLEDHRVFNQK